MPTLPKEILEESLKNRRFGSLVRAALTYRTYQKIRKLKKESHRSFHDIFRVLLSIYKKYKNDLLFEAPENRIKKKRILNVRLSNRDALDALNWAWLREEERKYFLGTLAEVFFARVPFKYTLKIFREQVDRLYRIIEEVKCSNWKNFQKELILKTSTHGFSDASNVTQPLRSGKRRKSKE